MTVDEAIKALDEGQVHFDDVSDQVMVIAELRDLLSRAQADRAIVEKLPVKVEYQELCNEVWRFAKAYPLGLENDIAPMNKIAIEQAVKLLAALASTPQPGQGDEGSKQ